MSQVQNKTKIIIHQKHTHLRNCWRQSCSAPANMLAAAASRAKNEDGSGLKDGQGREERPRLHRDVSGPSHDHGIRAESGQVFVAHYALVFVVF